jgi:deoxyadenosine/deoxycytidine kinase
MKNKLIILCILLFSTSFSFAQNKLDSWKELKEFHGVMSQTFHPSEEGNLEPIKTRATEMKEKAFILADSKIPAEFDNEKVRTAVLKLKEGADMMERMVAEKISDKEINDQLVLLHNTFHEIIERCVKGNEEPEGKKEEPKEVK